LAASIAREADIDVTLIELKDFEMPLCNGDLESDSGLPENAKRLKQLFVDHDRLLIASPEYNSSISPLLKILWIGYSAAISRMNPLFGRTMARSQPLVLSVPARWAA